MNKTLIALLLISVLAIGGMVVALRSSSSDSPTGGGGQANVRLVDNQQIIEITAKGGYRPRVTVAKANTPTTLNVRTDGTFDCSTALTIPAIGYRTSLPPSGVTSVTIPPQPPGTTIKGLCSMGMYSFSIKFE